MAWWPLRARRGPLDAFRSVRQGKRSFGTLPMLRVQILGQKCTVVMTEMGNWRAAEHKTWQKRRHKAHARVRRAKVMRAQARKRETDV